VVVAGLAVWAAGLAGRTMAVIAAVALIAAAGAVTVWLPRVAHRAFRDGHFARARRLYWLVGALRFSPAAARAAHLSRSACDLALGRYREALERIDAVAETDLDEAGRAVWHNNRAYALARLGEGEQAVACATVAVELRPRMPGFRHTRGIALLSVGKLDEAIRELDEVWSRGAGEATGLLEAERCLDLGRAWKAKGETEYALDYFARARQAAPRSSFAAEAARELGAV
jgi:tetratricopeptide (TPR) repeat protein